MCPCSCIGKRNKVNYLEKTINDVTNFLRENIFSEEIAFRKGFLQKIDPRVKVITTISLIFTAALIHNVSILLALYFLSCLLALSSGITLKFYIKRVWLVVPLFTGIMLIPSLFNFVRPGDNLFTLIRFSHQLQLGSFAFPQELAITRQGLSGAFLLIVRVGLSVSLALLMTVTTRWAYLLKALRVMFMPKIFIATLEMCYRYIFILLSITSDMFMARKSRTFLNKNTKEGRQFVSNTIGTLFGKSLNLSEEVYSAMLSRGYRGEPRLINRFKFTLLDLQWIIIVLLVMLTAFGGEILLG